MPADPANASAASKRSRSASSRSSVPATSAASPASSASAVPVEAGLGAPVADPDLGEHQRQHVGVEVQRAARARRTASTAAVVKAIGGYGGPNSTVRGRARQGSPVRDRNSSAGSRPLGR